MKRTNVSLIVLMLLLLLTSTALAQGETSTGSEAPAAYITINLAAGFPLDPFFVSVNGGGEVDASTLAADCTGFINTDPTVTVNWTGTADLLRAFFVSAHDPVLIIQTPGGHYLCNDDANALLLDPVVRIDHPAAGRYNIWVGSYAANQLLPGVLVLTARPKVNPGTFELGNLIRRPKIPEELPKLEGVQRGVPALLKVLENLEQAGVTIADLKAGFETVIQKVMNEGTVPAFEIPGRAGLCNGLVNTAPDYAFDWSGEAEQLRIFFEGDSDATLLVHTPDSLFFCNDDALGLATLNPLVEIPDPAEGLYSVFVGRVNPAEPLTGDLTVTESSELMPEVLGRAE
jgi:serine protease Do